MPKKSKLTSTFIIIFLTFIVIWNLISFIGASYPFFTSYYPGKWIILKKLWFVFLPSNLIFLLATLVLAFAVFNIFKNPELFKKYSPTGLALAAACALLNCLVIMITINSFTPSWIRAFLNFLGLIIVLFY